MAAGPIGPRWAASSWSDTAWEADTWSWVTVVLTFVLDLNTRLAVYLRNLYSDPDLDLTTGIQRYLRSQTGDYSVRWRKLIQAATDAMT